MAEQPDRGKIISRTLIESSCRGKFLSHILMEFFCRAAFTFQDTGEPFYHMLFYHNAPRFFCARQPIPGRVLNGPPPVPPPMLDHYPMEKILE